MSEEAAEYCEDAKGNRCNGVHCMGCGSHFRRGDAHERTCLACREWYFILARAGLHGPIAP